MTALVATNRAQLGSKRAFSTQSSGSLGPSLRLVNRGNLRFYQPSAADFPRVIDPQASIEDNLRKARATCKVKISSLTMHFSEEWRHGLFAQIDDLLDPENWDSEDRILDMGTFTTFLRLLVSLKEARRPGIGITYNGAIISAWTTKSGARLTVECRPADHIRWMVSHEIDGEIEVASGSTTIHRFLDQIAPYHPGQWLGNGSALTSA
jgi:hypothetical protein